MYLWTQGQVRHFTTTTERIWTGNALMLSGPPITSINSRGKIQKTKYLKQWWWSDWKAIMLVLPPINDIWICTDDMRTIGRQSHRAEKYWRLETMV